jgi:hypothetical protein
VILREFLNERLARGGGMARPAFGQFRPGMQEAEAIHQDAEQRHDDKVAVGREAGS